MGRTDGLQHTALRLQTLTGNLGGKGMHKTVPLCLGIIVIWLLKRLPKPCRKTLIPAMPRAQKGKE